MGRVLVTGGTRSGKSTYAEALFQGVEQVTYIATGYPADRSHDPEWADRVAHHQASRPQTWTTRETLDVARVLDTASGPVMIDCIGLWLTRTFDALDAWQAPRDAWQDTLDTEVSRLVDAWSRFSHPAVTVTNEVGWGVVPDQRAGRLFADSLGRINQRLSRVSDEVVLLVAGRPLKLSD